MIKLHSSITSTGLERTPHGIKEASVVTRANKVVLIRLVTFRPEIDNVKQLYIHHPILTTALDGKEVLIRFLNMPLTKEKDIEAALAFQAEPLLPYTADQALLAYQIASSAPENTSLILLATRKETVQTHLEFWQTLKIEPEKVSCVPSALCQFGAVYFPSNRVFLILHLQQQDMTCVLLKEGKLMASFAQVGGLDLLQTAQKEESLISLPKNEEEWQALEQQNDSPIAQALKRLKKEIIKMGYALGKDLKGEMIEGISVTGDVVNWEGLSSILIQNLKLPLLKCVPQSGYSSHELLNYAVPIGLALGSLPNLPAFVDFRQQEWSYPHPWRRLLKPLTLYFIGVFLLCAAFYFFGQQYLHYQEDQLRQMYVDLLSDMHKSHEQFERAFVTNNPKAHEQFDNNIPWLTEITPSDLVERLAFLQKELQANPDSFPLFANIPRVSDVLGWLSHHPTVIFTNKEGQIQSRLQIENFSYIMLKRPQQGKKQEKYQVKIELEFSSPTPKEAREFHDALIAPNEWVDPKGEVKWSSNRGKYKTSFFLKDKTSYPSS